MLNPVAGRPRPNDLADIICSIPKGEGIAPMPQQPAMHMTRNYPRRDQKIGAHVVVKLAFTVASLGLLVLAGRQVVPGAIEVDLLSFTAALVLSTVPSSTAPLSLCTSAVVWGR